MSWKKVRLGGLVNKIRTINPTEKLADESILYVDISAVDTKQKTILDPKEILGSDAPSRARQVLLSGDVLVSTVRPNLNAVALFTNDYPNVTVASTGFCVLRPQEDELDSKYLFYWSQSIGFISSMIKKSSGANYPAVSDSIIKSEIIPLPPLPTQKHIASILDKADALRQQNRQLLAHYDALLQSTFIELFGDPVENPKGWEVKRLGEIAEVVSGVAKNSSITGDLIEAPYMRVANVQDGNLDLTEIKTISVFKRDFDKYQLKKNDILMTEGGDPDKLGRAAIWNDEVENCIHQNHIFRVRPDFSIINSWFLCNQFGSSYGKRYFLKAAKQTTGIASINMTQLKNFPALLPPVSVQRKFGEISQEIESQKQQAQAALAESEALFQGLLAGYFGEN